MLHLDRNQIETLREKVSFLQDFLEVHSQRSYEELEGFARQIAAVAIEADDIIDARVVDQLTTQSGIDLTSFWKSDIDNLIEKIDSIKKELMMIEEGITIQEHRPGDSNRAHSSAAATSGNNTTIGLDEQVQRIKLELKGEEKRLQVLPIVGMGGIGKSTLAKTVFDDRHMVRHFDVRTWVSISQDYSVKRILSGFLREKTDNEKDKESVESLAKLGEQLRKELYDRRYLIVMDDVWSAEVWDELRTFFPDNSNGSRIMVTTRLSNVAVSFRTNNRYVMNFLDDDKSWDLLCEKAFPEDGRCPSELEKVGKSIAKSCKGLPLAIVVIGGLLSKSNMTREHWESVAANVNSFANSGDDEHCLKILSLSYNHLPIHLKPCFLHMGVFPEDAQIDVSKLIKSWVEEGFLKPIKDKTLEEVALEYLDDLIGRSLILFHKWDVKDIFYSIHDLLRDLCIKESHREHFYRVPKIQRLGIGFDRYPRCTLCSRRNSATRIDLPQVVVSSQPTSVTSLVCDSCRVTYPPLDRLRFVKVLHSTDKSEEFAMVRSTDKEFAMVLFPTDNSEEDIDPDNSEEGIDPDNSEEDIDPDNSEEYIIVHPTKLRVLSIRGNCAFKFVGNLLHLLWNLHTLIIEANEDTFLPSEIWELTQLRHLIVGEGLFLPDPLISQVDRKDSTIILKNLHMLSKIINFRWSEDAIERVPNLRELCIAYYGQNTDWSYYSLHILGRLHKLESLVLQADAVLTLKNISLPRSLKKLSLKGGNIPWEEMTTIGSLPNLEVLKISLNAFEGPEWNPIEEEFLQLKELTIYSCDLKHWGAKKIHFPNLEHLELVFMYDLEIPSDIGDIVTLRTITVNHCRGTAENSAIYILEDQRGLGNEDFQLFVRCKMVHPSSG